MRKADNQPPSSADVRESGSLNFPETSGPHRPVTGNALNLNYLKPVKGAYNILQFL
jgi:hypothetical protein